METDYDNQVGFWIKGVPYLWVQGKSIQDSKRFYILYHIAVFDEQNLILDPEFIRTAIDKRKINSAETFSITPFPKEKECPMVRNYFLAWTFSDPAAFHTLKFSFVNEITFPWTQKADIRIEGKKIGEKLPKRMDLVGKTGILEIVNNDPSFSRRITTIPSKFGNPNFISKPGWIEAVIEYHSKNREPEDFHNILSVQQTLWSTNRELETVHIKALYNLLAELYLEKKKEEDELREIGSIPPYGDEGGIGEKYNELNRHIKTVVEYLKELGETPRENEQLKYGWIYRNEYLVPTYRILYEIAIGKRDAYSIRNPVTGNIYPAPKVCYISSPLKDWIQGNKYYQDRKRKWEFELPTKDSYQELCLLSHEVQKLFKENMSIMQSKYSDEVIDRIIEDGRRIYDKKPAFQTGVTWSQDDYSHLGLQIEYLRYKSIQRFTETWELMRRANNLGLLRRITDDPKERTIRVCSMAGGPGFELYAIKRFFHKYYPHIKVIGASLDLEESWRPYAEIMGFTFQPWNTIDGKNFIRKCGGKIDIAIVSYSLYMYMSKDEHINWLSQQIRSGEIPILLVNSRKKNLQNHKDRMARKGVIHTSLLDQSRGRDDRQIAYHSVNLKRFPQSSKIEVMFPNVPFE
jgi:hypothetical protein